MAQESRCFAGGQRTYSRRQPEKPVLYEIVHEHLDDFLQEVRDRTEHGFGLPAHVERQFKKYLDCGLLDRGFVRVRCDDCHHERLVAFSCKSRAFCPSCTARRMDDTAAHLVDRVLPHVPYRQWVLSLPRRVRFLLACDSDLLGQILRITLGKVFAWQRRCARALGIANPHCGSVTFCQRFGTLLALNVHFHVLVPDGVFAEADDGEVHFHPLPAPWDEDIERIANQVRRAVERRLARDQDDHDMGDATGAAHRAVQAEAVHTPRSTHANDGNRVVISRRRCAFAYGYSLHADRCVAAEDREGLEKLCRYGARSPIALSRLSRDAKSGNVILRFKRPLAGGQSQLTMKPTEFLRKLAAIVPPPRRNLTRYHGLFAANHHLRRAVVPAEPEVARDQVMPLTGGSPVSKSRRQRLDWAQLLKRVYAIDVLECDQCVGRMRILAVICESEATIAILDCLGM